MNIAYILKFKASVAFLYSDFTMRQALEKMKYYGYTAIPVIQRDGKYYGTISEGDFLWYLTDKIKNKTELTERSLEETPIKKLIRTDSYKPVKITSTVDELLNVAMNQNFVPVTDDFDSFIGIVTRKDVIKRLVEKTSS